MAEKILAPLPGKIWKLSTAVGETVKEDDEVLIIEALKMETPVYAPCGGEVTAIRVKEGDDVEEDHELLTIEPA